MHRRKKGRPLLIAPFCLKHIAVHAAVLTSKSGRRTARSYRFYAILWERACSRRRHQSFRRYSAIYKGLCLSDQLLEVVVADEAFRVDLVDILGPRRTRREPAIFGHDLKAANGLVVTRRMAENALDRFTRQCSRGDLIR